MIGLADRTLDQVTEGIADPGFERETDGWLVLAEDGLPVGYATTFGKSDRQMIEIEVTSQNQAVAAWLFEQTMQASAISSASSPAHTTSGSRYAMQAPSSTGPK